MGYSPQSGLSREQWLILVLAMALGLWLTMASARAQTGRSEIAQIKADFDAAMRQSLQERVTLLEAVEQRIETILFEQDLTTREQLCLLELEYLVQVNLAKYPESQDTFGRYAAELKGWDESERARVALLEWIDRVAWKGDHTQRVELIDKALQHWSDDAQVTPKLLYKKAHSLIALNGHTAEAIPVLNKIITEYLDSSYRPRAYLDLAALQASGVKDGGGAAAAITTLELTEQQYRGTKWEQAAHMLAAEVFEKKQGEAQQALSRYQQTLEKFPDHWFATYCRAQIARLQNVIEQQIIQDALEELGKKDEKAPDEARVGQAEDGIVNDPSGVSDDTPANSSNESHQISMSVEQALISVGHPEQ